MMFRLEEYVPKKFIFKWEDDPKKIGGSLWNRCEQTELKQISQWTDLIY